MSISSANDSTIRFVGADGGSEPIRVINIVMWDDVSTQIIPFRRPYVARLSRGWRKHVRRQKQAARLALFR